MKKLILTVGFIIVSGCSATDTSMKFVNKGPRGIAILNIYSENHSRAYQSAEKHCAKYSKVPRVLKRIKQSDTDDSAITMIIECMKPSK